MILTDEILDKGKSIRGSWNEAQLKILGTTTSNNKGWKKDVLGKEFTEEQINEFLSLTNSHLIKKEKYKDFFMENTNKENNKSNNMLKFEDAFNDISRINKKDPATNAERLGKLLEETGELAKAINKTNGRKVLKEEDTPENIKKEILDEAADSIQNVISIIDGFGFTYEDLVLAMNAKNKKWEENVDKTK